MKRSIVDDVVQPMTQSLGSDKTRLSLALSIALAFSLPLPTNRLVAPNTPELYYINNELTRVNRFVSEFNERFLINVGEIAPAIKKLYATRYNMLFGRDVETLMSIAKGSCPIRDFLAGFSYDNDTIELIIATGVSSIDRVERILLEEAGTSSEV